MAPLHEITAMRLWLAENSAHLKVMEVRLMNLRERIIDCAQAFPSSKPNDSKPKPPKSSDDEPSH